MELCDYGAGMSFFVDGFPDFTRQNMSILEHLIRVGKDVTVSLNCDEIASNSMAFEKAGDTAAQMIRIAKAIGTEVSVERVPGRNDALAPVRKGIFQGAIHPISGAVSACRADSPYEACEYIAQRITELTYDGCRYRDISVVCTDMALYQPMLQMILRRCRIPAYDAGTEEILQKSVIVTVLAALDAALGGFETEDVLRYLKSMFSPVTQEEADEVENYAFCWGIRGNRWTENWKGHPDGLEGRWDDISREKLDRINRIRACAMDPLYQLHNGFKKAVNVKQQVLCLYQFLEQIELADRLNRLAAEMDAQGENRNAQVLNQLWEILLNALEQLYDILGETSWEQAAFLRLFRLLLSQYNVGTIPPVLDSVMVGSVDAMRCQQAKHLFVLGAEEGMLPGYAGSAGVLSDQERVALRNLGVPLTGGALDGLQAEFAEIYGVFCGAQETITVLCAGEQPAAVYRRLAQMSGGELSCEHVIGAALADPMDAAAFLAQKDGWDEAVFLGLENEFRTIAQATQYDLGRISRDHVRSLYGTRLTLSASQIDRQAECRLSYFLKYGIRAKERKEVTVDPAEFGTYVHAVLEMTASEIMSRGGFHQVSLDDTLQIAKKHSLDYAKERYAELDSQRMAYLFQRNTRELEMVVQELWEELHHSQFEPTGFEVGFGDGAELPAVSISGMTMDAVLRGFVDRVDRWKDYFRVVDYKTGKKDFDYCDVFNGVGLQMLLYLFALASHSNAYAGQTPLAAGVQYFPARVPYLPSSGRLTEEEAQKLRRKEWKRRGLLLKDEEILDAMDPQTDYGRLSATRKKDCSIDGDVADREQLKLLEKYLYQYVGNMVDDIASGNVTPNPYTRGSSHNACTFCPYGKICHQQTVEGRRNYKTMTAQRFWEEVRKEVADNGRKTDS
jgi:ATP-dependent helicase/nuclease subunit B